MGRPARRAHGGRAAAHGERAAVIRRPRWRHACCPTCATSRRRASGGRRDPPCHRLRPRPWSASSGRSSGRPRAGSTPFSVAQGPSAVASIVPAPTSPFTSSASSRWSGGWWGSPRQRRTPCSAPSGGAAAPRRRWRCASSASPPGWCSATTTCRRRSSRGSAGSAGGVPHDRRAALARGGCG